jgi:hypothetical protein
LVAFALAVTASCSSNRLVGTWKLSQTYDYFHRRWEPVNYESNLEFSKNGRFKAWREGTITDGTFLIDETVIPPRLVLTGDTGESVKAIFRLDGDSLTMKSTRTENSDSQFPTDLVPSDNETGVDLSKFERKHVR